MALSGTVQLRDGMSNVLSRIASNLSAVNDRFERMQSLTEHRPVCIHNLTVNWRVCVKNSPEP